MKMENILKNILSDLELLNVIHNGSEDGSNSRLLLENGSRFLLETGGFILLENN